MKFMNFLGVIFFIGIGLMSFFASDWLWALQDFKNRAKGLTSTRTNEWEFSTTIGGVLSILLGFVILILSIAYPYPKR